MVCGKFTALTRSALSSMNFFVFKVSTLQNQSWNCLGLPCFTKQWHLFFDSQNYIPFDYLYVVFGLLVRQIFCSYYKNSDIFSVLQTCVGWTSQIPDFVFCIFHFSQAFDHFVSDIDSFECVYQSCLWFNVVSLPEFFAKSIETLDL